MPTWLQRTTAQTIKARTKASSSRFRRSGDSGGAGGSGRERGVINDAAVVVTITVTLMGVLPAVTGFGVIVQVASEGTPAQVKVTVPVNPPCPPTDKVELTV
jgi:hypothetical protein